MAYYNGNRILTKIVIKGVPHYFKVVLTKLEDTVEETLKDNTLYLTGDNVAVIDNVLTITDNYVNVNDTVLTL